MTYYGVSSALGIKFVLSFTYNCCYKYPVVGSRQIRLVLVRVIDWELRHDWEASHFPRNRRHTKMNFSSNCLVFFTGHLPHCKYLYQNTLNFRSNFGLVVFFKIPFLVWFPSLCIALLPIVAHFPVR